MTLHVGGLSEAQKATRSLFSAVAFGSGWLSEPRRGCGHDWSSSGQENSRFYYLWVLIPVEFGGSGNGTHMDADAP